MKPNVNFLLNGSHFTGTRTKWFSFGTLSLSKGRSKSKRFIFPAGGGGGGGGGGVFFFFQSLVRILTIMYSPFDTAICPIRVNVKIRQILREVKGKIRIK